MSNHMSAKALRLWSIQVEGAKLRRIYLTEARAVAFEARRMINQAKGLEVKRERTIARRIERAFGYFVFLYLQAMGGVYLWWWLGYW